MPQFGFMIAPRESLSKNVFAAITAENAGFDYLWVTEHFVNRHLYVTLASIAFYTRRIIFGPGVTNPYVTHPIYTAQALATLRELAPNRVVCGLGVGDAKALSKIQVTRVRPLTAIRDAFRIIRDATSKSTFEYKGRVFSASVLKINFDIGSPVPLFVGAQRPQMLQLGGELGDGVLINFASHPKDVVEAIKHIQAGAKRAGRKPASVHVAAYANFSIATKAEEAAKAAIPPVAFTVAESSKEVLERHNISLEVAGKIREALLEAKKEEAWPLVTQDMIDAFCICGSPDQCIEKLAALGKEAVDQIVIGCPLGSDPTFSMNLIAEKVLPHLKEN